MEKLIELLNEYDNLNDTIKDTIQYRFHNGYIQRGVKGIDKRANVWWYSKSFGFIKWLVENNKIDIERLHKIVDYRLEIKENYVNAHDYNSDCLLMLLSISDTPIDDLCGYLKTETKYTEEEQELLDLDYGTGFTAKFVRK